MANFTKITKALDRMNIPYHLSELRGGAKSLSYTNNGKFYDQVYNKVGKLESYTIENPETCEKITAELKRSGNDFTSIYKTKNTPMGYFTHDITITRNNAYKNAKWNEVKSVKKDDLGQVIEEKNVISYKNSDGSYDTTIETVNDIGQSNHIEKHSLPKSINNRNEENNNISDACNPLNRYDIRSPYYDGGLKDYTDFNLGNNFGI